MSKWTLNYSVISRNFWALRNFSYLADHIDEVEELTEKELGCVPVVLGTVPMLLNNKRDDESEQAINKKLKHYMKLNKCQN